MRSHSRSAQLRVFGLECPTDESCKTFRFVLLRAQSFQMLDSIFNGQGTVANDLLLRVSDDGGGVQGDGKAGGRGLANMRFRAEKLGGVFSVGPGPHGGTVVEWHVPLNP